MELEGSSYAKRTKKLTHSLTHSMVKVIVWQADSHQLVKQ